MRGIACVIAHLIVDRSSISSSCVRSEDTFLDVKLRVVYEDSSPIKGSGILQERRRRDGGIIILPKGQYSKPCSGSKRII